MLEKDFEKLYNDLKPMLSENEVNEFVSFVTKIDPTTSKEQGKKMIIDYLKDLVSKKVEEEGVKLIGYYENKLKEDEENRLIYD